MRIKSKVAHPPPPHPSAPRIPPPWRHKLNLADISRTSSASSGSMAPSSWMKFNDDELIEGNRSQNHAPKKPPQYKLSTPWLRPGCHDISHIGKSPSQTQARACVSGDHVGLPGASTFGAHQLDGGGLQDWMRARRWVLEGALFASSEDDDDNQLHAIHVHSIAVSNQLEHFNARVTYFPSMPSDRLDTTHVMTTGTQSSQ
jgi:hypothetical protein